MIVEERCVKCVTPQATYDIDFNKDGVCELCTTTDSNLYSGLLGKNEEALNRYIEEIKEAGKGKDYDCLVGLSGGRDSSYLLYLLKEKHGLRCMAAYHRTPFTPDIIDENVRMLTKKLDVPLVQMNISIKKHRDFARKMILKWIEKEDKLYANIACAPCKQHNHDIYKVAKKHDIPYIVFGGNKLETYHMGAGQSKKNKVTKGREITLGQRFKQMLLVAGRGFSAITRRPELILDFPILFKASILHLSNRTPYLRVRYSKIKMLDYYYLAEYDEKAVIKFLSEIGWQLPDDCSSTWRADCSFNEIKNSIFKKTTGMTLTDSFLSNSIRAGVLTREEALRRAEVEGKISKDRIGHVCGILDIPTDAFI